MSWSSHSGGADSVTPAASWRTCERQRARLGRGRETVGCLVDEHAEVHRLMPRRPLHGVEASQPEELLDEPAHAARLALDALEGVAVPGRVALGSQRQAGIGLDDRERRSQLVRRVRGEGQLALPRALDGHRPRAVRPPATEEDRQQQDRRDGQQAQDDAGPGVVHGVHRFAEHEVAIFDGTARRPGPATPRCRWSWAMSRRSAQAAAAGPRGRCSRCRRRR